MEEEKEVIVGMGQYIIEETSLSAEVAFIVKDEYQNRGIGTEILTYLTYLAKRHGLTSFTAEVLVENKPTCLRRRDLISKSGGAKAFTR
jgi:RimJ/RimL family protein N-acetyltransferase